MPRAKCIRVYLIFTNEYYDSRTTAGPVSVSSDAALEAVSQNVPEAALTDIEPPCGGSRIGCIQTVSQGEGGKTSTSDATTASVLLCICAIIFEDPCYVCIKDEI